MIPKTLKNFDCKHCNDKCDGFSCKAYTIHENHVVDVEEWKKVIIDWIKLSPLEKAKLITGTPLILTDEIIREDVAINKALMKIHDLTEEDLMTNEEINAREHGEVGNN